MGSEGSRVVHMHMGWGVRGAGWYPCTWDGEGGEQGGTHGMGSEGSRVVHMHMGWGGRGAGWYTCTWDGE